MEQGYLVLVTATVREMKSLLNKYIDQIPPLKTAEPVEWYWNKTKFLLLVTGIGPINAALEMGKLIGRKSLKGVLNFGIAGAFDMQKYPLLTTVVINEEIWPEYGLLTETGMDVMGLKFAHGCLNGQEVWDRIKLRPEVQMDILSLSLPAYWQQGRSLTVAGVSGTPKMAGQRCLDYMADFENMEGFALAWACFRDSIPYLEIRSISNKVGSRDGRDRDMNGALRALGSAFGDIFEV